MSWMMVGAAGFVFLALIHSVLGERFLLRPLFQRQAFAGLPLGARFSGRTLRFAWQPRRSTFASLYRAFSRCG